jgi:hypothetical protein
LFFSSFAFLLLSFFGLGAPRKGRNFLKTAQKSRRHCLLALARKATRSVAYKRSHRLRHFLGRSPKKVTQLRLVVSFDGVFSCPSAPLGLAFPLAGGTAKHADLRSARNSLVGELLLKGPN